MLNYIIIYIFVCPACHYIPSCPWRLNAARAKSPLQAGADPAASRSKARILMRSDFLNGSKMLNSLGVRVGLQRRQQGLVADVQVLHGQALQSGTARVLTSKSLDSLLVLLHLLILHLAQHCLCHQLCSVQLDECLPCSRAGEA